MLGQRDPQRRLFATATMLGDDQLKRLGFYGHLAREGHRLFKDEDFAVLYCGDNGRPSAPPSLLALTTLLQYYTGVSDAEAVDRCRFDLRWKVVLHLDTNSIEAPFAKSTFQSFRARLTLHEQEGILFEKSIREAKLAGLLPANLRLSLDTSPVRGRGAVKDTYNLLSDAIGKVLRRVAEELDLPPEVVARDAGIERHLEAPSIKGSVEMDWTNREEVKAFLAELLADCDVALTLAEQTGCGGEEVALLERVICQDVDREGEDGGPKIRRGVARERVPSVHDPEVRHGHKSSGRSYTGHKAHVAVADSGVVTQVDVTKPSTPEGSKVAEAVRETEDSTGSKVEEVLGDCAYSSRESIRQAEEVGVPIKSKMPSPPKGRFGPRDFKVSEDRQRATCPAGVASAKVRRNKDARLHEWSVEECGGCSFKGQCTRAARRTLLVEPDFHDRRAKENYARSSEGKQHLRLRVVVEHAIGRLKNLGAKQAKYLGRRKTQVQWALTAAVANLSLVWEVGKATAAV
jgi:hypothetical protein